MTTLNSIPAARPFVVAPGEGEHIWFTNASMTVKASAEQTGGELSLVEVSMPEGQSPPLHVQHDEHESFYILEGAIDVVCAGERSRAEAGAFVFLPRGTAHTFRVVGGPARMLNISVPGGVERFFRDGGRPAEGPGLPPAGPVDVDAMRAAAERHNSELVGPPLSD